MSGSKERPVFEYPEPPLRDTVEQGLSALLDELKQGKSQRLLDYLAFSSRFHRYSSINQLLIYWQCPQATYVAGYRKWNELGYHVRRGENGIRIFAPRPYSRLDPETGLTEEVVHFVVVSVFDASQLDDLERHPLPEFFTRLSDDQQELYRRLNDVVRSDGITVLEQALGREQGASGNKRILLKTGLDSRSKFLTLLHEYAHELLHWNAQGRLQSLQVKECHAEAVSFVVSHHFGIHNPFSADYIQNWGNTPKDLATELGIVRRAAAYVIDRLEGKGPSQATSAEEP